MDDTSTGNPSGPIDWMNVERPGWYRPDDHTNRIDGIFMIADPRTGVRHGYHFYFAETCEIYPNGTYRQDSPRIVWGDKPPGPKGMVTEYERMILGDLKSEVIKEQRRKGLIP